MIDWMEIEVEKVLGKPRPRVVTIKGHAHAYTPTEYSEYEAKIAKAYKDQGGSMHFGPVGIEIFVCRKMPKSRPKKLTAEPDIYKPDCDNIAKAVMDALSGVAYKDDSQVVYMAVAKNPRTKQDMDVLKVAVMDK